MRHTSKDERVTTLAKIEKTREYLDYLESHINNVLKAWEVLKRTCKDMRFVWDDYYFQHIQRAVELHDISKLSEKEFVQYRKHFFPLNAAEKNSTDFITAWEHHKLHNPHHWENWTNKQDRFGDNRWEINCVHMVLDWMAMGYFFEDTAQQYYESNKDKIILPDYAVEFIYEIFERVEEGES